MSSRWKTGLCRRALVLLLGGSLLQVSSCNDNVRDAVIAGLETTSVTLSNILIQALFDGLTDDLGP